MNFMAFYGVILISSYWLTNKIRCYALATNQLDIPNHRSLHKQPTPSSGGLAIVSCFLVGLCYLKIYNHLTLSLFKVLMMASVSVALLGFFDDRRSVPASWRLMGHFVIGSMSLWLLGGIPAITVLCWTIKTGLIINILGVFYIVWLLNLYNFMDGINGLAAFEAISVCLGGGLLYYFTGHNDMIAPLLLLAIAVMGFLCWNFPVAYIFMGDVGSGFLGLILGLLSISAASLDATMLWSWLILLGVFIVDATLTLLFRIAQGSRLATAHRHHAYQHAACYCGKHWPVTMMILLINISWLLPIALAVGCQIISAMKGLIISYIPLIILILVFKAGIDSDFSKIRV